MIEVVKHCNYQLGCQCRTLHSSIVDRLGVVLLAGLRAIAWLMRHAVQITNRYGIKRDGARPYERHRGQLYHAELCELSEVFHWLVLASKERKFDSRTSVGLWLGRSSRGDSHLMFDDEVRTVKRMPEERRWQVEPVLRVDALSWLLPQPRVKERLAQRRRRCITWNYIREYGGPLRYGACAVGSACHNKQVSALNASRRPREDAEAAVARAGAEISMTQGKQASSSSGAAPAAESSAAADTTTTGIPVGEATWTRQAGPVSMRNMEDTTVVPQPQAARRHCVGILHQETQTLSRMSPTARSPGTWQVSGCVL